MGYKYTLRIAAITYRFDKLRNNNNHNNDTNLSTEIYTWRNAVAVVLYAVLPQRW
jgi:hypothetical protein